MFNKIDVRILRGSTLVATGIAKKKTYFLRTTDTALYTTKGEEVFIFEKSVAVISSGAIDASENSKKIPQAFNQKTNAFRLWHERFGHVSPARVRLC